MPTNDMQLEGVVLSGVSAAAENRVIEQVMALSQCGEPFRVSRTDPHTITLWFTSAHLADLASQDTHLVMPDGTLVRATRVQRAAHHQPSASSRTSVLRSSAGGRRVGKKPAPQWTKRASWGHPFFTRIAELLIGRVGTVPVGDPQPLPRSWTG